MMRKDLYIKNSKYIQSEIEFMIIYYLSVRENIKVHQNLLSCLRYIYFSIIFLAYYINWKR